MMQSHAIWSSEKQQLLADKLTGFWAEDVWNMNECPLLSSPAKGLRYHRFTCVSPSVNLELKYVAWSKYSKGNWSPLTKDHPIAFIRIIGWINEVHPTTSSFLEKDLEYWLMSLRTFLQEKGRWWSRQVDYLAKNQTICTYEAEDRIVSVLTQIYKVLEDVYDGREEYERDVWRLEVLGIPPSESSVINFKRLLQPWLRQTVKIYIRFKLSINMAATCQSKVTCLIQFSRFLNKYYPTLQPPSITRGVIEKYIAHLRELRLSWTHRSACLRTLKEFLELCARREWISVPEKVLIYKEDIPAPEQTNPRFIPEEVVAQLLAAFAAPDAPRHLELLIRIGLHTGMRFSEALALKRDCLTQDAEGDYWISFHIQKMKKDHSLPLDRELAQMIQTQQEQVRKLWGDRTDLLFPNATGRQFAQCHIRNLINEVVVKNNIRKPDGSIYRFEFHQLRHTCGTRMINAGYPFHIVQDWLAHESAVMTQRYAKLFDKTKKEAFQKYLLARGPLINIKGEVVKTDSPVGGLEQQMLKDQIKDRRLCLHNGHCTYPIALGLCPHYNACYQCQWFVTEKRFLPEHQNDLRQVEADLAKANQNGWERRIEKLTEDRTNLRRIIAALKEEGVVEAEAQA